MRPIAPTALTVLLLTALFTSGCDRALKVDPELGLQTVLSGAVTVSDTSEPSGVTISATNEDNPDISDSANTSREGTYRIAGLPAGRYSVDATKEGYYPQTKLVQLSQGTQYELDFDLILRPTGIPSKLVYIAGGSNDGDPDQEGTVGQHLPMPFIIEVRDEADQPLSNVQVTFTIIENQQADSHLGGRMHGQASPFTNDEGRVRATYIMGERVGQNIVRVQVFGLSDQHLDFTPRGLPDVPVEIQVDSGAGQSSQVGQALPQPIAVRLRDQYGNLVPAQQVLFNPSGDGQASPAEATSNASGNAQTTWTLGTQMGLGEDAQQLEITSGAAATTVLAEADHLAASKMVIIGGDNQSGLPNQILPEALQLMVLDMYDNPVDEVVVDFQYDTSDCSLSPQPPFETMADGLVSTTATPTSTGLIEIMAVAFGLPTVTFTISGISGQPVSIEIYSGVGQWGTIGSPLNDPFSVRLLDAFEGGVGNTFLHFEPGTNNGTPGTLDNYDLRTDTWGYAEVNLTLGTGAGIDGQWVTVTASGFPLVSETTIYASVYPDPPVNLTAWSGDNQQGTFGADLVAPLVVKVADQYNNPVPNEEISWTSTTGGSVSPNPSVSGDDGLSDVLATMGSDSQQTLQYFTASIAAGDSVSFTAFGVGHYIDQLIPASVPPGYPDPSDPTPENTMVPLTILGGGFAAGAIVVWDYWGTPEDITPDSVASSEIQFQLSADHFTADRAGVYMVSVRNPDGSHSAGAHFAVTHSIPDSGQDSDQCSLYIFNAPDWDWVSTPCSDIQEGETYYGQDGHYHSAINQPSFHDNSDGTITDNLTQMDWTKCALGQTGTTCSGTPSYMSQPEANLACLDLLQGGHDDWELPSISELVFIADYGLTAPSMDETFFPNPPDQGFWSSTVYVDESGWAWRFTAQQGRTEEADGTLPDGIVRCVRNRLVPPTGRFVRSAPLPDEPIVTDTMTGLVWQGCTSERFGSDCLQGSDVDFSWQDGLAYCEGLTWAGKADWRMPQIKELFTIIDHGVYWPSIDTVTFPHTPFGWRYSATNGPTNWTVMGINIGIGLLGANSKDWGNEVRCVRSDY